jgi:rhodanese-related sulfurtransferase
VRDTAEYATGHVLGARHVAHDQLERRIPEIAKNKNRPVIVYCDGNNRSGRALDALKKLGYARAYNLAGGYAGWKQAGLPVEK